MGSLGKSKIWGFQQYNSSEKYKRVSQGSCLQILILQTSLPWLPSSACSLLLCLSQSLVLQLTILLGVFAYAVKLFQTGTMSVLYTIDSQHKASFLASNSWPTYLNGQMINVQMSGLFEALSGARSNHLLEPRSTTYNCSFSCVL